MPKFKVGDRVFAFPSVSMDGYAEYHCMPETGTVAVMPAVLTFGEAAGLSFGAITALDFFRRGNLQRSGRVLLIWSWCGRWVRIM